MFADRTRRLDPSHITALSFGHTVPGPQPCKAVPFPTMDWDEAPHSTAKINLLFVCRTHTALGPMAAGLARSAYSQLDIHVDSAGLAPGAVDPRAVAVMAEIDIDISRTPSASVDDLKLETFEIVVSLGIHKLGVNRNQIALSWDVSEFEAATDRPALPALREIRNGLATRIAVLGAVLTSAGRA
jgi:protein-tyrosine-phosphatase